MSDTSFCRLALSGHRCVFLPQRATVRRKTNRRTTRCREGSGVAPLFDLDEFKILEADVFRVKELAWNRVWRRSAGLHREL